MEQIYWSGHGVIQPIVYQECNVETMTNGDMVVTVYGNWSNCETYVLKGE